MNVTVPGVDAPVQVRATGPVDRRPGDPVGIVVTGTATLHSSDEPFRTASGRE